MVVALEDRRQSGRSGLLPAHLCHLAVLKELPVLDDLVAVELNQPRFLLRQKGDGLLQLGDVLLQRHHWLRAGAEELLDDGAVVGYLSLVVITGAGFSGGHRLFAWSAGAVVVKCLGVELALSLTTDAVQ